MKGKCSYYLSKHCHNPNGIQSFYNIRLINKNRNACSSPGTQCEKEFEVRILGEPVVLLRKKPLLTLDGKERTSYYRTNDMQIDFLGMNNVLLKSRKAGITVLWTGENLYLTVDSSLSEQTCGLCGTFDGDITNDFHTHDDDTEVSAQSFAGEWAIQETGMEKCVDDTWEDMKYCEFYGNRKSKAVESCKIVKGKGTEKNELKFQQCHKLVSPDVYYDNCLSDSCASDRDHIHVIHAYVKMCADKGIIINWWYPNQGKRELGE